MAFNGSGTFLRVRNWVADAASGTKIRADYHDAEDDNLAGGLSNCLTKDGQTTPTGPIKLGGQRLINVADPASPQDVVTLNYLTTNPFTVRGNDSLGRISYSGSQTDTTSNTAPLGIEFTQSDLFFGTRRSRTVPDTKPNRWIWNDAANGSGTDQMTLSEAGALTVTGGITSSQSFASSTAAAILSTATAGTIYLRPVDAGSATGQLTLGSTGDIGTSGHLTVTGNTTTGAAFVSNSNAFAGAGAIYLRPNGAANDTGRMTVDSSGHVTIGSGASLYLTGHVNNGLNPSTHLYGNLQCKNGLSAGYGGNTMAFLWNSAAVVMFVDNSNLGTINTTSDYRIKKDVADLGATWDAVKALRPVSYTGATHDIFVENDILQWGFIAHEVQGTLLPTAASGEKDMEGGVQGLNWAPIVAALTKALQEAMARIEALEGAAA